MSYQGQPPDGQPPQGQYPPQDRPPYSQAPYGQPQYHQMHSYPEQSQATMVLVMGILGLALCQLLAPVAWFMGNQEIAAIDAGRRPYDQRSTANIGRILGMVMTIFLGVIVLVYVALLILGLILSMSGGLEPTN